MDKSIGLPPLVLAEKSPTANDADAQPTEGSASRAYIKSHKKLLFMLGSAFLFLVVVAVYIKFFVLVDKNKPPEKAEMIPRTGNREIAIEVNDMDEILAEMDNEKEGRSKREAAYYPELVERYKTICKDNPTSWFCKNIRYYQRHISKESTEPIHVNRAKSDTNIGRFSTDFDRRHYVNTNKATFAQTLRINKQDDPFNDIEFNRRYLFCHGLNCHEFSLNNSTINKALTSGNYRITNLTEALTQERNMIFSSYKDKCVVDRINQFCDSLSHELQKMDTIIKIIADNNKTQKWNMNGESVADVTQNKQIICLGSDCDPTVIDISSITVHQNSNGLNLDQLMHYLQTERNKLLSVYHVNCSSREEILCRRFSIYLARLESLITLFKQPNPTMKSWEIKDESDGHTAQNSLSSEKIKTEDGPTQHEPCKACFDTLTDEKLKHFHENNISSVLASLRNNRDRLLPAYMHDCVPFVNNSICQTSLQHLILINTLINEIMKSDTVPKPTNQPQTEKSISFENGNLFVKSPKGLSQPFMEDDKPLSKIEDEQKESKNKNNIPPEARLMASEYALSINRPKMIHSRTELNRLGVNMQVNPIRSTFSYRPRDYEYTHKDTHESQRIVASNEDRSIHGKGSDAEFHVPSAESVKTSAQSGFSSSGAANGYQNPICFYPSSPSERSNIAGGVLFPFTSPDAPLVNEEGISPRANDQFTGYGNLVPTMILAQQPNIYPYTAGNRYYPVMQQQMVQPHYVPPYFNPYYTQRPPFGQYGAYQMTGPMLCSFINQQNFGEAQQLTSMPLEQLASKQQNLDLSINYRNSQERQGEDEAQEGSRTVLGSKKDCEPGMIACADDDSCISTDKLCDGMVDCSDASDETKCTCKLRIDKSRLCDGYFDCPLGEDEMGCFGCQEDEFSCDDWSDRSTKVTCMAGEHRCNQVVECPNAKDEMECNMLAPSAENHALFSVSHTEGYLLRNNMGRWYPVCDNPYRWAQEACLGETGVLMRSPFIQLTKFPHKLKTNFVNHIHDNFVHTSPDCYNNSAMYVTCHDLLCGTRVKTMMQAIREKADTRFRRRTPEVHFYDQRDKGIRKFNSDRYLQQQHLNNIAEYDDENEYILAYAPINDVDINHEPTPVRFAATNNKGGKMAESSRVQRAGARVVGGRASAPAAWPWLVAMYKNGMFHCGGSIISKMWILSAAHCVDRYWEHYYEIQIGMLRRFSFSPQEQNIKVSHILLNKLYQRSDMKNDLSLLRLEKPVQYNRWVRPICLPSPSSAGEDWFWGPRPGTYCSAIGWGATAEHGSDPDHMREVEVPILPKCIHNEDIEGKEICAGYLEGGKDTCQGDSGGPLLCRNPTNRHQWYIAGIVSHGEGCARKNESGVYTRVSLYIDWINNVIMNDALPPQQPKQECPGFTCSSGISRCIPKKRFCDKVVDCLGGDDEEHCDSSTREDSFSDINWLLAQTNAPEVTNLPKQVTPLAPTGRRIDEQLKNNTRIVDVKELSVSRTPTVRRPRPTLPIQLRTTTTVSVIKVKSSESKESFLDEIITDDPINKSQLGDENDEMLREDGEGESDFVSKLDDLKHKIVAVLSDDDFIPSATAAKGTQLSEANVVGKIVNIESHTARSEITISATTQSKESSTQSPVIFPKFNGHVIKSSILGNSNINNNNSITSIGKTITNVNQNTSSFTTTQKPIATNTFTPPSATRRIIPSSPVTTSKPAGKFIMIDNKIKPTDKVQGKVIDSTTTVMVPELEKRKLLPASRKLPATKPDFQCRRIPQTIPYKFRCNHVVDCEDTTDEFSCSCLDYIISSNSNLHCDGFIDCPDGSDEQKCEFCSDGHFLCKSSKICLPIELVCDGKGDCPQAEEEMDCFALSDGKELSFDADGRTQVNLEGYLTRRQKDSWEIVCDDGFNPRKQEETAIHICNYLGFSNVDTYKLKFVNIWKNKPKSNVINLREVIDEDEDNEKSFNNVCSSLYVKCLPSLHSNITSHSIYHMPTDNGQDPMQTVEVKDDFLWPWVARIFVEGVFRCTGILVDVSWVLISQSCIWDVNTQTSYICVVLGSNRILEMVYGPYEQAYEVDGKRDIVFSNVTMLHLKDPAQYSRYVKPMILPEFDLSTLDGHACVAVGRSNNNTVTIFLKEIGGHCGSRNKCFVRHSKSPECDGERYVGAPWTGIVTCLSRRGWYPAAAFYEPKGNCGFLGHVSLPNIEYLRTDIKSIISSLVVSIPSDLKSCFGVRCHRGLCIPLGKVCDGIQHCADGADEREDSCYMKKSFCARDPFNGDCDCNYGQMRCRNGSCIGKEFFADGVADCEDGSDEPSRVSCASYLSRVAPKRLCDGVLHCADRSDEDPYYCKCFSKKVYKCQSSELCVSPDVVCDDVRDCPLGDDEKECLGLGAPTGTPYGRGEVMERRYGLWHTKCFYKTNLTRSELENICKQLGFLSGHAVLLGTPDNPTFNLNNRIVVDNFTDISLNSKTKISLRNNDEPLARAIVDYNTQKCYAVYIECL